MRIKDGFLLRSFGEEHIVVAVGEGSEDFNKLITLNDVGAYIFKTLSEDISMQELVDSMIEKYGIDKALAEKDAENFVTELKKAGLLDA